MSHSYLRIGMKGLFTFLSPFNVNNSVNEPYEIESIRSISELLNSDVDVFKEFYEDKLTNDVYLNDLANKESIVTFRKSNDDYIYVPTSYITEYPNLNGKEYKKLAIVIELLEVEADIVLNTLISELSQVVTDSKGITDIPINIVDMGEDTIKSFAEHTALQTARNNLIADKTTFRAKYLESQRQLQTALAQKDVLEEYIRDNHI